MIKNAIEKQLKAVDREQESDHDSISLVPLPKVYKG